MTNFMKIHFSPITINLENVLIQINTTILFQKFNLTASVISQRKQENVQILKQLFSGHLFKQVNFLMTPLISTTFFKIPYQQNLSQLSTV